MSDDGVGIRLQPGPHPSNLAVDLGELDIPPVQEPTYVGRMLRLTSLAPDIVEAILRGDEPDGISLRKLQKNLPVRWDE